MPSERKKLETKLFLKVEKGVCLFMCNIYIYEKVSPTACCMAVYGWSLLGLRE